MKNKNSSFLKMRSLTESLNKKYDKLNEDYYILIPTENRYDEPIDIMKFARKYGVFKTSEEAMDKMNELAPDRWDAFITYRLIEESMKDKVKSMKLNESSYSEPLFETIENALYNAGLDVTRFSDAMILSNNLGWVVSNDDGDEVQIECLGTW